MESEEIGPNRILIDDAISFVCSNLIHSIYSHSCGLSRSDEPLKREYTGKSATSPYWVTCEYLDAFIWLTTSLFGLYTQESTIYNNTSDFVW